MSSTINVHVPTEPMARSVDQLALHMDGTTAAVVAMKVATIAAEKEATDLVCTNVNRGFRSLIVSQISQKSAKAKAVLDAKLMELMHQKGALQRVHQQMDRDYHRIAARYRKLFQTLDLALKSRIFELERLPALLSGKQMPEMERRIQAFGGQPFVHQAEGLGASQALAATKVRADTLNVIRSMHGILDKTQTLQTAMAGMADRVTVHSDKPVLLPVVLIEADDITHEVHRKQTFAPLQLKELESRLKDAFSDVEWAPVAGPADSEVRSRCMDIANRSSMPDRVRHKFAELLKGMTWQAPGGQAS